MNGQRDDAQLAVAAAQNRFLLTANVRDFVLLHQAWLNQGKTHAGIIVIPQQRYSTGEIIRRLLRLSTSATKRTSELYYLSNYTTI